MSPGECRVITFVAAVTAMGFVGCVTTPAIPKEAVVVSDIRTPEAAAVLRAAFPGDLIFTRVDVSILRYKEAPQDAHLVEVKRQDGAVIAYLHARRGTWRGQRWPGVFRPPVGATPAMAPKPMGPLGASTPIAESRSDEPPEPAVLPEPDASSVAGEAAAHAPEDAAALEAPSPDVPPLSPKEQSGRSTVAQAERERSRPQPALFAGVLADALVFAGPRSEGLFELCHSAQHDDATTLQGDLRDGLAGRPRLFPGRVAEWGPFPYIAPSHAAESLLELDGISTAIIRAVDAHSAGPHETLIMNAP